MSSCCCASFGAESLLKDVEEESGPQGTVRAVMQSVADGVHQRRSGACLFGENPLAGLDVSGREILSDRGQFEVGAADAHEVEQGRGIDQWQQVFGIDAQVGGDVGDVGAPAFAVDDFDQPGEPADGGSG